MTDTKQTFDERFEASEDTPSNPQFANTRTIGDIIATRFNRRDVLRGSLGATAIAATMGPIAFGGSKPAEAAGKFNFKEIEHGVDETHHVAEGYDAEILIRWGDAVLPGAPVFDPMNQSAAAQEQQFGYNNDFIGYVPLPLGSSNPDRALLCVNHEYTSEEVMFPGIGRQDRSDFPNMTQALVDIEMAAHGGSVVEIEKSGGKWSVIPNS
ncbi:MAG: alkaline phosphatase PhoX, partial [Pseudomonadota bacterium]